MANANLHVFNPLTFEWLPWDGGISGGGGGGGGGVSAEASSTANWSYAAASGGITDTSDVTLAAAPASTNANYLTGIDISNASPTVDTEVVVKDGSTVIWRGMLLAGTELIRAFATPLVSSAGAALKAACITTAAKVYINAQGYTTLTAAQIRASVTPGEEIFADDGTLLLDDNAATIFFA